MTTETAPAFRNRIVGSGEERPDRLLANPANWRVHPANQTKALAGALATVGWVQQVMVNRRTGYVVDGHARVALAIERDEPMVPVLYVDLDPQEEALVLATLDPLAAMAGTDDAKLRELLAGISVDDTALRGLLADLAGARRGLIEADDAPPISQDPYVQVGDLWAIGDHRLLCGSATDPAAVARLLDGEQPRLLATDPPYGVSLDPTWRDNLYNQHGPAEKPYMRTGSADPYMVTEGGPGQKIRFPRRTAGHTNTTVSGDTRVDWSEAFELVPSLEVGYVWHAGIYAREVAEGLERIGFKIASQVIWDKGLFAMSRGWYHWGHEPCWVVRKPGAKFRGKRNQSTIWHDAAVANGDLQHPGICCLHQSDVWRVPSPKMIMGGSHETKFDHPAQKPVALSQIPISNHTARGDSVYDAFLGSGTTLIAAETLGRRCYGMELEPRYAQLVIERWQAFTGRQAERLDG